MMVYSIHFIYFSPTGTTRKVIQAITTGLDVNTMSITDLTHPYPTRHHQDIPKDCLAVFGVPVYGGRVPHTAVKRMAGITGQGGPAAIVVVYGNRAFEDALLELRYLVTAAGHIPIAGAEFIGEHSLSSKQYPIAINRPDKNDCQTVQNFGKQVKAKLNEISDLVNEPILQVPGNYPFRRFRSPEASPETESVKCIKCGNCADSCPEAAIYINEEVKTNTATCIVCCACVKACQTGARKMQDSHIQRHMNSANPSRRRLARLTMPT